MSKIKIKVCGMTRPENTIDISSLSPDYLGFIFYPGSLRYVGENPDPELFQAVPGSIQKVAVFVNENLEKITDIIERYNIDLVQLHGRESPELCESLKKHGVEVIKVIPADQLNDDVLIMSYLLSVDYLLFDTSAKNYGGTGRKFDWSKLENFDTPLPFFLSGGIAPADAGEILKIGHSAFYAADINSCFETEPGIKDVNEVSTFIKEIRNG